MRVEKDVGGLVCEDERFVAGYPYDLASDDRSR